MANWIARADVFVVQPARICGTVAPVCTLAGTEPMVAVKIGNPDDGEFAALTGNVNRTSLSGQSARHQNCTCHSAGTHNSTPQTAGVRSGPIAQAPILARNSKEEIASRFGTGLAARRYADTNSR
jgi:hypothetical protein